MDQINKYQNVLIPQSNNDIIKEQKYEINEEQAYQSNRNQYDKLLYDVSATLFAQTETIAKINSISNLETTTQDAEIFVANEIGEKSGELIRNQNINEIEKHRLYQLIKKENIMLKQYYNDLVDKLTTYDRDSDFNSGNVDFYGWISKYMLYWYFIMLSIFAYYFYNSTIWEYKRKIAIFMLLVLYPFFIDRIEFFIYNNLKYVYSLIFAIPYKPYRL